MVRGILQATWLMYASIAFTLVQHNEGNDVAGLVGTAAAFADAVRGALDHVGVMDDIEFFREVHSPPPYNVRAKSIRGKCAAGFPEAVITTAHFSWIDNCVLTVNSSFLILDANMTYVIAGLIVRVVPAEPPGSSPGAVSLPPAVTLLEVRDSDVYLQGVSLRGDQRASQAIRVSSSGNATSPTRMLGVVLQITNFRTEIGAGMEIRSRTLVGLHECEFVNNTATSHGPGIALTHSAESSRLQPPKLWVSKVLLKTDNMVAGNPSNDRRWSMDTRACEILQDRFRFSVYVVEEGTECRPEDCLQLFTQEYLRESGFVVFDLDGFRRIAQEQSVQLGIAELEIFIMSTPTAPAPSSNRTLIIGVAVPAAALLATAAGVAVVLIWRSKRRACRSADSLCCASFCCKETCNPDMKSKAEESTMRSQDDASYCGGTTTVSALEGAATDSVAFSTTLGGRDINTHTATSTREVSLVAATSSHSQGHASYAGVELQSAGQGSGIGVQQGPTGLTMKSMSTEGARQSSGVAWLHRADSSVRQPSTPSLLPSRSGAEGGSSSATHRPLSRHSSASGGPSAARSRLQRISSDADPERAALRVQLHDALQSLHEAGIPFLNQFELGSSDQEKHGSQGVVRFARDLKGHEAVAIKFFTDQKAFHQEHDLYNQAELMSMMPAILGVVPNDDGRVCSPTGWPFPPCIVVEKGECLAGWAARVTPDFLTSVTVLSHLAGRLRQMHAAGMVHRDLKPGNVLWRPKTFSWTLIDFGCAAAVGEKVRLAFSLQYAAPETISAFESGQRSVVADAGVDLWSLGVMAYELLSKRRPFPPFTSSASVKAQLLGLEPLAWETETFEKCDVPELRALSPMILACLDRDPARRPSAAQLQEALDRMFDAAPQL